MTAPYLDNEELAKWIKDPSQVNGKDYQVVDVRDLDFEGGETRFLLVSMF